MQVKSRVLPTTVLTWMSRTMSDFATSNDASSHASESSSRKLTSLAGKRTNTGSMKVPSPPPSTSPIKRTVPKPNSLLQFAVWNNDPALFKLLLELGTYYTATEPTSFDEDAVDRLFTIYERDIEYMLKVGRPHLLAEVVKVTGAGIPLNSLAKKYGVELKDKPKYYVGLTVHGKKRKDWAQRGYDNSGRADPRSYNPPLLQAAHFGSLEVVEWLLSDTPMRCYKEFAEANQNDKRLKQLALSENGFEAIVAKFLNVRSDTVVHCCIAGEYTAEADELLRYLLQSMPESLEAKSAEGYTPLHVAFELYREDWARLLVQQQAGADQTCRDKSGKNILHSLLDRHIDEDKEVDELKRMLDLIDKRVLSTLFLERSTGSLTPLQYWLNNNRGGKVEDSVLKVILDYGGGKELSFISGEGDTPLHTAVKRANLSLTRILLDHNASLLNRENATGRTPYEMAEDAAIARLCSNPPPMPRDNGFERRRAERLQLHRDWHHDITRRSERGFVDELDYVSPSDQSRVWSLLQETKAKLEDAGDWNRRLVSLHEANQVAKRLAAMKSGSRVREDESDVESEDSDYEAAEGTDEVEAYMNQAKRSL